MAIEQTGKTPRVRRANIVSNLFAVAAIAFGILALVMFLRNPGGGGIAPVPTAAPGGNEIIHVAEALQAQGFAVEQPRGLFIPRGALQVPGQGVEIDGLPGFIFLYSDAEAAKADSAGVDPNDVVPERLAGTPTPAGEHRMTQGSNVAVLLVGGSSETWQKVETAVASLP